MGPSKAVEKKKKPPPSSAEEEDDEVEMEPGPTKAELREKRQIAQAAAMAALRIKRKLELDDWDPIKFTDGLSDKWTSGNPVVPHVGNIVRAQYTWRDNRQTQHAKGVPAVIVDIADETDPMFEFKKRYWIVIQEEVGFKWFYPEEQINSKDQKKMTLLVTPTFFRGSGNLVKVDRQSAFEKARGIYDTSLKIAENATKEGGGHRERNSVASQKHEIVRIALKTFLANYGKYSLKEFNRQTDDTGDFIRVLPHVEPVQDANVPVVNKDSQCIDIDDSQEMNDDISPKDQGDTSAKDQGDTIAKDQGDTIAKDQGDTIAKDKGDTSAKDKGDTSATADEDDPEVICMYRSMVDDAMEWWEDNNGNRQDADSNALSIHFQPSLPLRPNVPPPDDECGTPKIPDSPSPQDSPHPQDSPSPQDSPHPQDSPPPPLQ